MAHTPTPWRIGVDLDFPIINDVATRIAVPVYTPGRGDNRKETAAFIVRACNAHDDLVASAQALCKILGRMHVSEEIGQALAALNASLTKAKDK